MLVETNLNSQRKYNVGNRTCLTKHVMFLWNQKILFISRNSEIRPGSFLIMYFKDRLILIKWRIILQQNSQ